MIRRVFRSGIGLGLLAGLAYAAYKVLGPRLEPDPAREPSPPLPLAAPTPAKPAPAKKQAVAKQAWVEAKDGVCPTSHPVKAKLTSKIFHLPGGLSYDRTNPDRCYADAAQAEADGLRAAKR